MTALGGPAPRGRLVRGADGSLYGTLEFGSPYGSGGVFCLTADGNYRIVHSFWDGAATST
ncbi:MAG TPA: choice-of-anchor tandem repeat GloVer-containing protein [Polyangia bacterium]